MSKKGGRLSGGLGLIIAAVLFGTAGFLIHKTLFTAGPPTAEPVNVLFMCSETGKIFEHAMTEGESWPVNSPYTNKKTGYPVERCYWTRDGKRKLNPTYVILNDNLGKPGDTICPDCGRLVIGHNPPPPQDVPLAEQAAPSDAATPADSGAAHPLSDSAAPQKAQAEGMIYATVRAKMEELIAERAAMIQAGRSPSDPTVRQFDEAILRARDMLVQRGEQVPEIIPPIAGATASAPDQTPAS